MKENPKSTRYPTVALGYPRLLDQNQGDCNSRSALWQKAVTYGHLCRKDLELKRKKRQPVKSSLKR